MLEFDLVAERDLFDVSITCPPRTFTSAGRMAGTDYLDTF